VRAGAGVRLEGRVGDGLRELHWTGQTADFDPQKGGQGDERGGGDVLEVPAGKLLANAVLTRSGKLSDAHRREGSMGFEAGARS
jgi:hypothetical protein